VKGGVCNIPSIAARFLPLDRFVDRLVFVPVIILLLSGIGYSQPLSSSIQVPLAGSRVFGAKGCSNCHAINGVGAKVGPDLGQIQQNRSFSDIAAAMWNHLPQMALEAQKRSLPLAHLDRTEAGDLIAFLFTQNYFNEGGDVSSGKMLFVRKSCIICHQVGGVGGVLGPKLDAAGQSGSPIQVAAAMWNHGPAMAEKMRAMGISRPRLSPSELKDLVAYLKSAARQPGAAPLSLLPGRASEGRLLFDRKQCIKCHRVQGSGGNAGPDLGKRGLYRDVVEFGAALWNKAPAMLHAMKLRKLAVPALSAEEMADIVAYLRSFQYFGEPGSGARGGQILIAKQCVRCHAPDEAGSAAPDLGRVKGLTTPADVIAALWNHGPVMEQRSKEHDIQWPQLNAEEMTHLMAFFYERSRRSER
jgi:mono/diheme cytochrome c family protein